MSSINDIQKSTSSIELFLHPLVIINISDHYTRTKMNGKDSNVILIFFNFLAKSTWSSFWTTIWT